jgi:hypothetical protein
MGVRVVQPPEPKSLGRCDRGAWRAQQLVRGKPIVGISMMSVALTSPAANAVVHKPKSLVVLQRRHGELDGAYLRAWAQTCLGAAIEIAFALR